MESGCEGACRGPDVGGYFSETEDELAWELARGWLTVLGRRKSR